MGTTSPVLSFTTVLKVFAIIEIDSFPTHSLHTPFCVLSSFLVASAERSSVNPFHSVSPATFPVRQPIKTISVNFQKKGEVNNRPPHFFFVVVSSCLPRSSFTLPSQPSSPLDSDLDSLLPPGRQGYTKETSSCLSLVSTLSPSISLFPLITILLCRRYLHGIFSFLSPEG